MVLVHALWIIFFGYKSQAGHFSTIFFLPTGTLAASKIKPVVEPITTVSPYRHTWSYVPNFVDYHSPTSR